MNEEFTRHFYHPIGVGDWYVLEEEEENYFYGFVNLVVPEWGYFSLHELIMAGVIEDENFTPTPVAEITGGCS